MNFDGRYHIVRIDGWIILATDYPPTLADLKAIAIECGRSVFVTEPDENGTIVESGYACPHHSKNDYLNLQPGAYHPVAITTQ